MALKRVTPHPDREVVGSDGKTITGMVVVDVSIPFYARRLADGDLIPYERKKAAPKKKDAK